jgi:hypothetical protein
MIIKTSTTIIHPKAPVFKPRDPDEEEEKDEDKYVAIDPIEKIWDLKNEKDIHF